MKPFALISAMCIVVFSSVLFGQSPSTQPTATDPNATLDQVVKGKILRKIPVSKDCMILQYMEDWKYGEVDNLAIASMNGGVRTLVSWTAPNAQEIAREDIKFVLALYCRKTVSGQPDAKIHVMQILENWPEKTSWATQPKFGTEPFSETPFTGGKGWKVFDVTVLVRSKAAGRPSFGAVLKVAKENAAGTTGNWSGYQFVSHEAVGEYASFKPVLCVVEAPKTVK